jgi:hypothetical protein
MRRLLFLLVLGCASSGQSTTPKPRTILTTPEGVLLGSPVEQGPSDSVAASPETVMRALLGAYEGLGLTVTLIDPAKRRLGNPGFTIRRALQGVPLHEYLSCGETVTGLRADDDRITMSVISTVRPTPAGGTALETLLEATATDVAAGNSGDQLHCSSSGKLETRIHTVAKQRLGR